MPGGVHAPGQHLEHDGRAPALTHDGRLLARRREVHVVAPPAHQPGGADGRQEAIDGAVEEELGGLAPGVIAPSADAWW